MKQIAAAACLALALGCASQPDAAPPTPADARTSELQTSMTELLERLDVMNERLARLEEASESGGARAISPAPVPAPRTTAPATPRVISPEPAPAAATTPAGAASRALRGAELAELYRTAIVHFGSNRVAEARAGFQRVFDADPSSELADNALFWIGETYYASGDFANAISHYRRVSQQYGDQNKAPDAVYKLALAYAKTGDLALARQTFQEVITRYPYSTSAASAKAELERIKY
ncbi:MAG TPA: tol-pal system protein YbgF [Thermoanaerobaculia bacterium]|nr:tol-pal system protein YbgF [Thermoanaerobaculia bacterium]